METVIEEQLLFLFLFRIHGEEVDYYTANPHIDLLDASHQLS